MQKKQWYYKMQEKVDALQGARPVYSRRLRRG